MHLIWGKVSIILRVVILVSIVENFFNLKKINFEIHKLECLEKIDTICSQWPIQWAVQRHLNFTITLLNGKNKKLTN